MFFVLFKVDYLVELEKHQHFQEEEEFELEEETATEEEMTPAKNKYDSQQLKVDIASARERVCLSI